MGFEPTCRSSRQHDFQSCSLRPLRYHSVLVCFVCCYYLFFRSSLLQKSFLCLSLTIIPYVFAFGNCFFLFFSRKLLYFAYVTLLSVIFFLSLYFLSYSCFSSIYAFLVRKTSFYSPPFSCRFRFYPFFFLFVFLTYSSISIQL